MKTKEEKSVRQFPPNLVNGSTKHPQMSKKIEVKVTKKKGRMLVAKDKIEPGEVLIHERAFCTILYAQFRSSHCNSCFKVLQKNATEVCPHCKEVRYCSQACRLADFDWFHWAECGLVERFQRDESIGIFALLVYRLMVKSGLRTCLDTYEADPADTEKNSIYDSEDYAQAFLQVTHEDERDPGEVFKRACIGLYLTHHLNLAGFFPSSYTEQQPLFDVSNHEVVTIVTLIVRHLQSCSCNAYEIDELVHDSARQSPDQVLQLGGAVFPTVSLSNHSCVPNTTRNYDGTTCIIRSACTIRKGEEITDNYGLFFQIKNEDQRQEVLSKQYFFQCQCIACKQQWPTFPEFRGQISSFICSGCRAPQQTGANKGLAKKCAKCKKDLKPLHQAIKLLSRFEHDVKSALTSPNFGEDQTQLVKFTDYLKALECHVDHPNSDFIICQQVIAQWFALKGNISFR